MRWLVYLAIWFSLKFLLVSCKIHTVPWTPDFFQRFKGRDAIIFGRPGDQLVFSCPMEVKKDRALDVWAARYKDYRFCGEHRVKPCRYYTSNARVMSCGPAHNKTRTLDMADTQVFSRGSLHYFYARYRRRGEKMASMKGPLHLFEPCDKRNMKLAVHVCDRPSDIKCNECSLPLGMEDGRIEHGQIRSSDKYNDEKEDYNRARLQTSDKCIVSRNSWRPTPSRDHYLEVNLRYIHLVSAVATQGAHDSPRWVTKYHVTFAYPHVKTWFHYRVKDNIKVFRGNTDQHSVVRHWLKPPIQAQYVRFHPQAWSKKGIGLRVELYGCAASSVKKTVATSALNLVPIEKDRNTRKEDAHALCGTQRCPPYAKCRVSGGKVKCSCAMNCRSGKRVCGDDGILYGSFCHLAQAACEGNTLIKVQAKHACATRANDIKSPKSNTSSLSLDFQLRLVAVLLMAVGSLGLVTFFAIVWSWGGKKCNKKSNVPSEDFEQLAEELRVADKESLH